MSTHDVARGLRAGNSIAGPWTPEEIASIRILLAGRGLRLFWTGAVHGWVVR